MTPLHVCTDSCDLHCHSESQRAVLAARAAVRPVGRPSGNAAHVPLTQREAASRYAISERALRQAKRVLDSGHHDLVERLESGQHSLRSVLTELVTRRSAVPVSADDSPEIRRGDFREVLADIEDNSVNAIVTDVPWPVGGWSLSPDLYPDLAKFARRVLVPGGVCAALVGQRYLPQLIAALADQLDWCWQLAYVVPAGPDGSASVYAHHYPVVVFTNGPRRFGLGFCSDVIRASDVIEAEPGDKSRHEHAKSVDGMAELISRVSDPGDLLVDPFAGSGATGRAACKIGRRFVGSDIRSE